MAEIVEGRKTLMDGMAQYSILFYAGTVLMGVSIIGGLSAFVVQRRAGRRLRGKLEAEYGKKRR